MTSPSAEAQRNAGEKRMGLFDVAATTQDLVDHVEENHGTTFDNPIAQTLREQIAMWDGLGPFAQKLKSKAETDESDQFDKFAKNYLIASAFIERSNGFISREELKNWLTHLLVFKTILAMNNEGNDRLYGSSDPKIFYTFIKIHHAPAFTSREFMSDLRVRAGLVHDWNGDQPQDRLYHDVLEPILTDQIAALSEDPGGEGKEELADRAFVLIGKSQNVDDAILRLYQFARDMAQEGLLQGEKYVKPLLIQDPTLIVDELEGWPPSPASIGLTLEGLLQRANNRESLNYAGWQRPESVGWLQTAFRALGKSPRERAYTFMTDPVAKELFSLEKYFKRGLLVKVFPREDLIEMGFDVPEPPPPPKFDKYGYSRSRPLREKRASRGSARTISDTRSPDGSYKDSELTDADLFEGWSEPGDNVELTAQTQIADEVLNILGGDYELVATVCQVDKLGWERNRRYVYVSLSAMENAEKLEELRRDPKIVNQKTQGRKLRASDSLLRDLYNRYFRQSSDVLKRLDFFTDKVTIAGQETEVIVVELDF